MSGNFKVRVVENTGNESESLFGAVGSVFDIVNGKLEDKEGFCWDRGGEGFKDILQVNEKFDGGAWGTVFELVGHMTLDRYQELCTRTVNSEQSHKDQIVNYSLGMVCEAAEVGDEVKKQMFHGHKLDSAKIKDELGDTLWYISNLARKYGLTLSEVAEHNVEKLKQRYPDGFKEQDSINRD